MLHDLFVRLRDEYKPKCPLPMNKQKGEKRAKRFTCLVNMIVEKHAEGLHATMTHES